MRRRIDEQIENRRRKRDQHVAENSNFPPERKEKVGRGARGDLTSMDRHRPSSREWSLETPRRWESDRSRRWSTARSVGRSNCSVRWRNFDWSERRTASFGRWRWTARRCSASVAEKRRAQTFDRATKKTDEPSLVECERDARCSSCSPLRCLRRSTRICATEREECSPDAPTRRSCSSGRDCPLSRSSTEFCKSKRKRLSEVRRSSRLRNRS